MALEIQKGLLRGFIQNMYDEGFVNDQFYQMQAMQNTRPEDVMRAITSYCTAAENLFSRLTFHTNRAEVDFRQVHFLARDLYARTSNIGAEHVKLACAEIMRAAEQNNKEQCCQTLYWTKNEFTHLRRKFETVVQMERRIIELASRN
ncbi:hypothetical protein SLA2020_223560 [Shorea laevis]